MIKDLKEASLRKSDNPKVANPSYHLRLIGTKLIVYLKKVNIKLSLGMQRTDVAMAKVPAKRRSL